MSIRRKLRNLWRRSWSDRWLLVRAYFILGIARMAILTVRFQRLAGALGQHMAQSAEEISPHQLAEAKRVAWAVARASRLTPWTSNCFPQAITAQFLLRRRGIATTLYLGAMLDDQDGMKAHAWLRCGRYVVTGRPGHRQYGVVATFADGKIGKMGREQGKSAA